MPYKNPDQARANGRERVRRWRAAHPEAALARKRTCSWPIGDPGDAAFHYCGLPLASVRASYCAEHMAHAHRGPTR
jgi:GcrA cell cycle regulator